MDETEFWEIIDRARGESGGEPQEQADLVVDRLVGLDPDSVLDFARHFETRVNRAHHWDLWAAASVLLGGAGEEAFDAFRCWLVGQGRHVFEGALHDADDLADLLDGFGEADGDGEDLGCAADEAYEQLTGAGLPELGITPPAEPEGDPLELDDDAAVRRRCPRLAERYDW